MAIQDIYWDEGDEVWDRTLYYWDGEAGGDSFLQTLSNAIKNEAVSALPLIN